MPGTGGIDENFLHLSIPMLWSLFKSALLHSKMSHYILCILSFATKDLFYREQRGRSACTHVQYYIYRRSPLFYRQFQSRKPNPIATEIAWCVTNISSIFKFSRVRVVRSEQQRLSSVQLSCRKSCLGVRNV